MPCARGMGWVDLNSLMEIWQKRPGKMVEHLNKCQPNPGPQGDGTSCIVIVFGSSAPYLVLMSKGHAIEVALDGVLPLELVEGEAGRQLTLICRVNKCTLLAN